MVNLEKITGSLDREPEEEKSITYRPEDNFNHRDSAQFAEATDPESTREEEPKSYRTFERVERENEDTQFGKEAYYENAWGDRLERPRERKEGGKKIEDGYTTQLSVHSPYQDEVIRKHTKKTELGKDWLRMWKVDEMVIERNESGYPLDSMQEVYLISLSEHQDDSKDRGLPTKRTQWFVTQDREEAERVWKELEESFL